MSPKPIKAKKRKTRTKFIVVDSADLMHRKIAKMYKERNRLAKKRRVDYIV